MNICCKRLGTILKQKGGLVESTFSSIAGEHIKRHYDNHMDRINSLENNQVSKQFFEKAYEIYTKEINIAQKADDLQVQDAFLSRTPLKDILRTYVELKSTRNLNQFLIANSLQNVSRVFASRQDRSATYWDLNEERLFLDPGFVVLLNDVDRVMEEIPIMDLDALTKITQALLMLKIKDGKKISHILEKFDHIISMNEIKENQLQSNPKLLKIINYFLKDETGSQTMAQLDNQEDAELTELFSQLKKTLQQKKGKFLQLVDALSQIKKIYKQILEIQDRKYVTQNVNLNFQLLELEEQFVELGLLSLEEVVDQHTPSDPEVRLDQLMNKAVDFISSGDQSTVTLLKTLFPDNTGQEQEPDMDLSPQLNLQGLSRALNELAELLNRSGSQDEMINDEWSQSIKDCDYDRGLSSLYNKGQQKFRTYFTQIKTFIEEKNIKPKVSDSILLALTFAKIGLFESARYFKDNILENSYITHEDMAYLAQYSLLSNTKLDQSVVNMIETKFLNESNQYDDKELSIVGLSLLFQNYESKVQPNNNQQIVQIIIDRFYTMDSLAELDRDTIENLQDIQTYCKVVLVDKEQQNSMYKVLIGSKASSLYSQSESSNLNPYIMQIQKLFKETSNLHQQFGQFPFPYQPQIFHYNSTSNQTIGVMIVPTRYLDGDGQVDGRVLFRRKIMQQFADTNKLNLRIKILPLTDLFKFDRTNNSWNLAEKDQFNKIIKETLEASQLDQDLLKLTQKFQNIQDIVEHQIQLEKDETLKDLIYHKLSLDYKQLQQLAHQVSQCITSYEKAVLLEELKIKSIFYLKTISNSGEEHLTAHVEGVKAIVTELSQLINKLQIVHLEKDHHLKSQSWIGSLQSQSLGKPQESVEGFCVSLLDPDFYVDNTFCIYGDLKRQLDVSGLLNKSMFQTNKLQTLTASLILYPNLKATGQNRLVELLPNHNQLRKQIQPKFRVDWRDLFKNHPIEQQQDVDSINEFLRQDQENKIAATQEDWFVLNLQNLKAEIKNNYQPHEIVSKILSLEFWDQMLKERTATPNSNRSLFLARDPRELLNYNLKKSRQQQIKSPSLFYLATVRSEKKFLRELMKHKNSILRRVQLEAAENRLTATGADAVAGRLNNLVENALKHHKLRNSPFHSSLTFKKQWSFVDIDLNGSKFDRLKVKTSNKKEDQDIILSQGDLDIYLQIKRSRAEDKLILYRIMLKIQSKQELNKQESAYLKHTSQNTYNYKSFVTSLQIKDLSNNDQQFFESFSQSRITDFGEYSLNEVILELSQFFDNQTYDEICNRFTYNSKELKEFDIKKDLLKKRIRNESHLIVKMKEQETWAKKSQLDEDEMYRLQEILAVPLKLQSLKPQVQQKEQEYSCNSLLLLNKLGFPQSIISKWVESRQEEISQNQKVEYLNEEQENLQLWQGMFGVSYQDTSSKEIGNMVESLCQRMFLMKTYEPFFTRRLFTMLIQHKNFTPNDRNLLASYVEIFKYDLKFTSRDILDIAQSALNRQKKDAHVIQTLVDSNYSYVDSLWQNLKNQQ